jgi:hypothetical protein
MLRGKMRKLKEAVNNQARSPSTSAHAALVKATERMVLVVDAVIKGMGLKDTRDVAKELAVVADDLSLAATIAQTPAERTRGEERMSAATMVLEGGGRSMKRLGSLGRDLGEIVAMDLLRVDRARGDLFHAALAAQDLAARLRQPDPSFGSQGGRPSHAGGESGGSRGGFGEDSEGEGGDVERAFNEAAQELERLTSEHAGQMGKVEQALADAANDDAKVQREQQVGRRVPELREHGDAESKLADRARDLLLRGRESLPQASLDALEGAEQAAREASRALKQEDADRGLVHQREAQHKLEMARDALGDAEQDGEDGEGERFSGSHTDIPTADQHKGPEEFRKRVIKGLGQPSGGRLKDAVKRYAEGLLR